MLKNAGKIHQPLLSFDILLSQVIFNDLSKAVKLECFSPPCSVGLYKISFRNLEGFESHRKLG